MDLAEEAGFKIVVESVSAERCVYLDLLISRGLSFQRTGQLEVAIHKKETSLSQPLRPSSFHPQFVHISWPLSMLDRSRRLCTHREACQADHTLLKKVWESYDIMVRSESTVPNRISGNSAPTCRLIVPYHSSWCRARLLRILARYQQQVNSTFGTNVNASIA